MYDTSTTLRHGSSCCIPIDHWWNSGILRSRMWNVMFVPSAVAGPPAGPSGCRMPFGNGLLSRFAGVRLASSDATYVVVRVKPVDVPRSVDESR